MVLTAAITSWLLTITPVGPGTAPDVPKDSKTFATQEECTKAAAKFMVDHQFTNWQGLKMNPLVRAVCTAQ
jgi:hypothetical protein